MTLTDFILAIGYFISIHTQKALAKALAKQGDSNHALLFKFWTLSLRLKTSSLQNKIGHFKNLGTKSVILSALI